MVEEEIDEILLLPEGDPVLAADEAEAVAEFEQEGLQAGDEAVFEFAFPHGAAQAEELQVVGTLEHLVGLLGEVLRQREIEVVRLLFRDRAFVGTGLDLVEQDIARPTEAGGGAEIPKAGGGIRELVQDEEVLAPWNFCSNLLQKPSSVAVLQFGDRLSQIFLGHFIGFQFGRSLWPNCRAFCSYIQFGDKLSPNCLLTVSEIEALHIAHIPR